MVKGTRLQSEIDVSFGNLAPKTLTDRPIRRTYNSARPSEAGVEQGMCSESN